MVESYTMIQLNDVENTMLHGEFYLSIDMSGFAYYKGKASAINNEPPPEELKDNISYSNNKRLFCSIS